MDLNTVSAIIPLESRGDIAKWRPGSAWLAGGSWLFSEPQSDLTTLLDLGQLDWPAITVADDGIELAATCTFSQLMGFAAWPAEFVALSLIEPCCHALLGSFKVWNVATIGGNICLALAAGPMIAFATALDGEGLVWRPDGSERRVAIKDLVIGPNRTSLQSGELLRSITLPAKALRRCATLRKASLSVGGRSAALLIGTCDADTFALTVTASTRRPVRIDFPAYPTSSELRAALDTTIAFADYYDDVHGRPAWRQHLTRRLAEEIREELLEA